ncbi:MAG: aldo/keto reductase [Planctomycetes bacterium]|nr:aldo/keto reductase [Planctomycetota bacterium]
MQTRQLGSSDLELTPVALGAWAIGGAFWGGQDEKRSVEAIHASLDAGINTIDTAPVYGFGASEEVVGRALEGRRDRVILATKCGLRWDRPEGAFKMRVPVEGGEPVDVYNNLRPDSIREECEASLRRLRTDWIDLYQIHWPDPETPLEESMAELVRLKEEGKIRAVGASNFSPEQLETAHLHGGIASDQPQYNLLDRSIEEEILPWCIRNGVGVVCYSPMARGLLTGKIGPDVEFPPTDHRSGVPWFQRDRRIRVLEGLETLRPIAEARSISLANLAVAWVISAPGVTAALVGARDAAQARENARAAGVRLSEEERRRIAAALEGIGG